MVKKRKNNGRNKKGMQFRQSIIALAFDSR